MSVANKSTLFRKLPSTDELLRQPDIQALIERGVDREPQSGPPTVAPRGPSQQHLVLNKIALDLQSCRFVGGRALCQFSVASTESDVSFFVKQIRVLDDEGIEYPGGDAKLGGQPRDRAELVAGVPMRMSLSLGVPQTARKWALLEFYFWLGCCDSTKTQFRNVQVMR